MADSKCAKCGECIKPCDESSIKHDSSVLLDNSCGDKKKDVKSDCVSKKTALLNSQIRILLNASGYCKNPASKTSLSEEIIEKLSDDAKQEFVLLIDQFESENSMWQNMVRTFNFELGASK